MSSSSSSSNAFSPLRNVFIVIVMVSILVVVSRRFGPKERIPWRTDLAAAEAEAKQAGKPVFVYFTASWCGPCESLKRTTWADEGVATAMRDYVAVKIDIDDQPEVAAAYRVQAVPTFVVVGESGPTHETSGALGPADFLRWLKLRAP